MIKVDIENLDDLRDKAKVLADFGSPYVGISKAFVETIDLLDSFASDNRVQALTISNQTGTIEAQKEEIVRLRSKLHRSDQGKE